MAHACRYLLTDIAPLSKIDSVERLEAGLERKDTFRQ